jgi:hypothetical protein
LIFDRVELIDRRVNEPAGDAKVAMRDSSPFAVRERCGQGDLAFAAANDRLLI